MLRFLFPRLTPAPERGEAMFAALTARARERHWYVEGSVPDTLEGRFRMLATLAALAILRLEQEGSEGEAASVALTEQFIAVMESEHRELGLGDPKLGRTVRKLVSSLARRVELWRSVAARPAEWRGAVTDSVYKGEVAETALDHATKNLQAIWSDLAAVEMADMTEGRLR